MAATVNPFDTAWISGLLEGEGCFDQHYYRNRPYPRISLAMTDSDTVEKAASILGNKTYKRKPYGYKEQFMTQVCGSRAAGWMMILFPYLGNRRQNKIKEILSEWKSIPLTSRGLSMIKTNWFGGE